MDEAEAVKWLRIPAEQNEPGAEYIMGLLKDTEQDAPDDTDEQSSAS